MRKASIVITLASIPSHSIWSLSGPFDTSLYGLNGTHKDTTASALTTALYTLPYKSFIKAAYGKNYPLGAKLPITVVHCADVVPDHWLESKLDSFIVTWERVSEDHPDIVSLRDWAGR